MDDKLREKHALIIAELHLLGVPVPLGLEPCYATKSQTMLSYKVLHRSGRKETVMSAVGVLRSCAAEANMNSLLPSLHRFYQWQADPEADEEAATAAEATPAPATPVRGSRPLPALRVTRSADKRQDAADKVLMPDAHASGAGSTRSRRAAAMPRTAARSAEQRDNQPRECAERMSASSLVAELQRTLAGWEAAEAQRDALVKSVERSVARVEAEYDKELKAFTAQKARRESSAAGAILDTLKRERQAAVAARQQEEQARIAPERRQLQQCIDAAQARCSELDAAIHACPKARMLMMVAGRPAGRGPRLLSWLQACLMSLGAVVALLMAVLLFSFCKLRWVWSTATKVAVVLVHVGGSLYRRLLSAAAAAAAHGPGQLAGSVGSLGAWLLRHPRPVQLPAWAAPGAAAVAAAAALEQAAAARQHGRLSSNSRLLTSAEHSGFSRAAAANAGSVWAATDKLEGIVLHARAYYQGQQAEPPSAAELIAVVVAVSRLVQAEFGAVEGRGECNLRDQVLRLLIGLLAVGEPQLIRSEASMGHGRSDLVLFSLAGGAPLLVVEYKLLPSEQGRHKRERNAAQLRRYLKDKVHGCREGLLITFDSALANGLSATRVVAVDSTAWARLLGERPEHAPEFTTEPCHHLDKDPWAVGAMAGICQQYGVDVLETADRQLVPPATAEM